VILDLIMPGMGGRRCLEEIIRFDPRARVLITSGYFPDAQSWNARGAGAERLVMKPYDRSVILDEVRNVLDEPRKSDDVKPSPV
jgi:two-component system, cell cycle sensor histidine kinase and response regulator CckA